MMDRCDVIVIQSGLMSACATCRRFHRVHRAFWERLIYKAAYECEDCKKRITVRRPLTFHLTLEAHCPRCGSTRLSQFSAPDNIEQMSRSARSLIQRWLGGRLYYCAGCRLQFYDWRSRVREKEKRTMFS